MLFAMTTGATAAEADTMAIAEHNSLWNNVLSMSDGNPALYGHKYNKDFSQFGVYADASKADKPVLLQLGDGKTMFGADVKTYLHPWKATNVWGSASYRKGKTRNIKWNSTSDFLLLYPYVMADTLGGEMHNERYTFSGGFSTDIKKWTIGGEMIFRAEHEWRTRDPRPRAITTDLTMRIGASYPITRNYNLGLTLGARFYKQTNDVDFYQEAGTIPEFHMIGLGADYTRVSGSNNDVYYKATGFNAQLDFKPKQDISGVYASVFTSYVPFKKINTQLNAMPMSTLYNMDLKAEAGWKHEGDISWSGFAGIDFEKRDGDEHISGSSSSLEYFIIGKLTMFYLDRKDYHIGGAVKIGKKNPLTVKAQGGYLNFSSHYVEPARRIEYSKIYGTLAAQYIAALSKNMLLTCGIDGNYFSNNDKKIVMPYASMDEKRTQLVNTNYESLIADKWTVTPHARIDYHDKSMKGYALFLEASGTMGSLGKSNNYQAITVEAGVTF